MTTQTRSTLLLNVRPEHIDALLAKAREKGGTIILADPLVRQIEPMDPPCYVVFVLLKDGEEIVLWTYNAQDDFFMHGDYFSPYPDTVLNEGWWKEQEMAFARYFERRRRG